MKTGNTDRFSDIWNWIKKPQWSPVMKTGNTGTGKAGAPAGDGPQWSPVMKTGNTRMTWSIPGWGVGCLNGARS